MSGGQVDLQRRRNSLRQQVGIGDAHEVHPAQAVLEGVLQAGHQLSCQPGLATAARPGEAQEANVLILHAPLDIRQRRLAANEAR